MDTETARAYLDALAAGKSDVDSLDLAKSLAAEQRPTMVELALAYPGATGASALGSDSSLTLPISALAEQDRPAIRLCLAGTAIDDQELERVAELLTIQKLILSQCRNITDEGMRAVTRLPFLEELHLRQSRLTDRGLSLLAEAPALRELMLTDCIDITPSGVATLAAIPTLTGVSLSDSLRFSEKTIEALRPQLPGCKIYWAKNYTWVPKASKM